MSRGSPVSPEAFFEYFDTGNWVDSKGNAVKNWKQKLLTWESRESGGKARASPDAAFDPNYGRNYDEGWD